jgi:hypothetical protein
MSSEVVNNLMAHFKTPAKKAERTQFEIYTDAVIQMENAIYELDQAHALLKDIGLHQYSEAWKGAPLSIETICRRADKLLATLRRVECEECGRLMSEHAQDKTNCDLGVF